MLVDTNPYKLVRRISIRINGRRQERMIIKRSYAWISKILLIAFGSVEIFSGTQFTNFPTYFDLEPDFNQKAF